MGTQARREFRRILTALTLFGTAFGFMEAVVVVDLRAVYEPLQRSLHPSVEPGDLFPLLTPEDVAKGPGWASRLLAIEVAREAATIVMLAGVGIAVGGRPVRMFAAFLVAFGIWDVVYYVALRVLIGWPLSLWTWDVLFLIPVPWTGPVITPVIVAATMVACGLHTITRDLAGIPIEPSRRGWFAVLAGAALIVLAFGANWRNVVAGAVPESFPWLLYGAGEGLAVAGYLVTALAPRYDDPQPDLGGPGCGS